MEEPLPFFFVRIDPGIWAVETYKFHLLRAAVVGDVEAFGKAKILIEDEGEKVPVQAFTTAVQNGHLCIILRFCPFHRLFEVVFGLAKILGQFIYPGAAVKKSH